MSDNDTRRALYRAQRLYYKSLWVMVGLSCLVVLASLYVNLAQINEVKKTSEVIQSCTSPGGACYKRNERHTAKVVQQIIKGCSNK